MNREYNIGQTRKGVHHEKSRITALLLTLALLLPLAASCGESAQNTDAPQQSTTVSQNAPVSDGRTEAEEPEADPNAALCEDLPKANYSGRTFTVLSKYARDEDSAEMIGLIRAGATYNFGAVNSTHIGSPGHIWCGLVSSKSDNIASKTGKNAKAMVKALEKFLDMTYLNGD